MRSEAMGFSEVSAPLTSEKPIASLLIANPVSSPPPGMFVRAHSATPKSAPALQTCYAYMGCKQRGFRGQRAFDHTTGQGYVKSQRGHYDDGIFTKRNKFNLLLHETFGGGFSPPAVAKINRLARKAQRSGVDRTAYPPHSRLSFVSHHAERISIASVKGVNRAILDRRAKLASELSRRA